MKKSFPARVLSALFLLVYCCSIVPASAWKELSDNAQVRMDHYLDGAELARTKDEWENYVNTGFASVLNQWEIEALAGPIEEQDAQEQKLKQELEANIQKRYEGWLQNLSRAQNESAYSAVKAVLDREEKKYVLEGVSVEEDSKKLAQWNSYAASVIDDYLEKTYGDSQTGSVLEEEINLLVDASHTRLLVKFYSEVKKNRIEDAEEAAQAVMQDILAKTTDSVEAQMNELFSSLETQLEDPVDTDFDSDSFMEQFKKIYEQSVELWNEAEQEFIKDRTEWEAQAQETYEKSCQVWQEALSELQEQRKAWEEKISAKINELEVQIAQKKADYQDEIAGVLTQYAQSIESQKQTYLDYTVNLVENYENLKNILLGSADGVRDWISAWAEKYRGIYSYWKTEDADSEFVKNEGSNFIMQLLANQDNEFLTALKAEDKQKVDEAQDEILCAYLRKIEKIYDDAKSSRLESLKPCEQAINLVLNEKFNTYTKADAFSGTTLREDNGYSRFVEKYIDRLGVSNPEYQENPKKNYEIILKFSFEDLLSQADGLDFFKELVRDLAEFGYNYGFEPYYSTDDDDDDDYEEYLTEQIEKVIQQVEGTYEELSALKKHEGFDVTLEGLYAQARENKNYEALDLYIEKVKGETVLKNDRDFELTAGFIMAGESLGDWIDLVEESRQKAQKALAVIKDFPAGVLGEDIREVISGAADLEAEKLENIIAILEEEKTIAQAVKDYNEQETDKRKTTEELEEEAASIQEEYEDALKEWTQEKDRGLEELKRSIEESLAALDAAQEEAEEAKKIYEEAVTAYKSEIAKEKLNYQKVFLIQLKNEMESFVQTLEDAAALALKAKESFKTITEEKRQEKAKAENAEYLSSLENIKAQIDDLEKVLKEKDGTVSEELYQNKITSLFKGDIEKLLTEKNKTIENEAAAVQQQHIIDGTIDFIIAGMNALYKVLYNAAAGKKDEVYQTAARWIFESCFDDETDSSDDYELVSDDFSDNEDIIDLMAIMNTVSDSVNSVYNKNKGSLKSEGAAHSVKNLASSYDTARTDMGEFLKGLSFDFEGALKDEGKFEQFFENLADILLSYQAQNLNKGEAEALELYVYSAADKLSYLYASSNTVDRDAVENRIISAGAENKGKDTREGIILDLKNEYYQGLLNHSELIWKDSLAQLGFETEVNRVFEDEENRSAYMDSYSKLMGSPAEKVTAFYDSKMNAALEFFTMSKKEYDKLSTSSVTGIKENFEALQETLCQASASILAAAEGVDSYNERNLKARIEELQKNQSERQAEYEDKVAAVKAATQSYHEKSLEYNEFIESLNAKMLDMETLRKELRIAQAVKSWAESVYLKDESDEDFENPAQALERIEDTLFVYNAYLAGIKEAAQDSDYEFDKTELEPLKKADGELAELLEDYDDVLEKYLDEQQAISIAQYGMKSACDTLVSSDWKALLSGKEVTQEDALKWLSSFYVADKPSLSEDFETLLLATVYYAITEGTEDQKTLISALDPNDRNIYGLNGAPSSREGVNCAGRYEQARLAYLKEKFELLKSRNADSFESLIEECLCYFTAGSLGSYLKNYALYYLKQGSLNKLISSLKKTESEHTYLSKFLFGVFKFLDDEGKAAKMFKGVAQGLYNGNRQQLEKQDRQFNEILGLYVQSSQEYEKLRAQAAQNGYSAECDAKATLIKEKEEEIEQIKQTIADSFVTSVNECRTKEDKTLADLISAYSTKNANEQDYEAIKQQAYNEWKGCADIRDYLEEVLSYYGSLVEEKCSQGLLRKYGSSASAEFTKSFLGAFNDILNEQLSCEAESYKNELSCSKSIYDSQLDELLSRLKEIERSGEREWEKAEAELKQKYREFQNEFLYEYERKTSLWQQALEGLEQDKAQWIEDMYEEAAARSLAGLEKSEGSVSARVSLEKARNKVKDIAQINGMNSTAAAVVNGILGSSSISYITSLFDKNASLASVNAPAYMLKGDNNTALFELREKVQAFLDETTELAQNVSSKAVSEQFKLEMERLRKESFAKIETKNRETEDAMDERAFTEGYTKGSNNYSKKIVTDVSVFSVKTKNVSVRLWKDFETDEPELDFDTLDYGRFDSSEFSVILSLISAQLGDWEENIFGSYEVRGVRGVTGELEKYSYGEHYRGELELGQGLIGQILLDFQKNAAKEQSGWDALEAPGWERKLWCSDTFPGPSVREFSTMVASIVATVCTFGAGAAVAIAVNAGVMAANELTFEMADVGAGWHDWDEAARNVAKAAVSGAITGAASSLSGVASQVGGLGGVFLKTGITSSSSITTQFTNAFIDDGFSGVKDAFNSWSDWQGIAFSTAGSFVTNGVGYGLSNTNFTGFNNLQMSQINSIAGTVGGLTTNALEYAFTGQTSFNLLNLSMFGLEYGSMWGAQGTSTLSGGLFSMTLGKDGTHFAISSAGTDISLGTLYSNAMGIGHIVENSKIESYASDYGNPSAATTLRIQYGYGDKESNTLLDEILSGKTKLSLTSEKKDGATAQTTTDANGNKTVTLYGISANMSVEEMFKAGLVLQHEAHRDGVNGENQSAETLSAVAAHTDMMSRIVADGLYTQNLMQLVKEDRTLQGDLIARAMGSEAFEKYVGENYDSTGDYWKFTHDGNILWDGSDNLYDENGNLLHEYSGKGDGHTAALAEALGITKDDATQLLNDYRWDKNKKTFVDDNGNDVKNDITKAAQTGDDIKARYDFQHNYADKIFEQYGGSMIAAVMCYQSDMQLGGQNITLSSDFYKSDKYFDLIMSLNMFAAEYDKSLEQYGNIGGNNVTQEIYDKIVSQTGWQSNDNILYQYLEDGTISPVVGDNDITTYAFYEAGLEKYGIKEGDMHSISINGTAADLGTYQQNLPVVSVFNSSFLIGNSYGYTNGGGYYISLYSNGLKTDYKHLLGSSSAYANVYSLNTSGHNAGIWSFPVPSNYQIGNVGNSGAKTTGIHLHFQNTKWR